MNNPFLVFATSQGEIFIHPYLRMSAASGELISVPASQELIPACEGVSFFYMPGRLPVGYNDKTESLEVFEMFQGQKVFAVAASLVPAYLRLYNPALKVVEKNTLPLWGYTACGYYGGRYYVAAKRVDARVRQSPRFYDCRQIEAAVKKISQKRKNNRLYAHLAYCALKYNCLAARNLFLKRWEAPLPTASLCNASCLGCLSLQTDSCFPSSQHRIDFRPKVDEVVEVMADHLTVAKEAIVSFGQGCEGEPLLEAELIAESVSFIRRKITRGTIHVNTNGSRPEAVKLLCQSGVDSFRISLSSAQEKFYDLYFRPKKYRFSDVEASIRIAKKYNKFVSLNLLVFPGFTDSLQEIKALKKFIKKNRIDMIQWRNLNIDPYYYQSVLGREEFKPQGISNMVNHFKQEFPGLKMGYFNLPKEKF